MTEIFFSVLMRAQGIKETIYVYIYIYRVQLLRSDKWLQMIQMKVHFAIEGLCLIVISIFSSIEGIIDFSNFPLSKGTHIIIPHVPCDLK